MQDLCLNDTQVTDGGLKELRSQAMRNLVLVNTRVTDVGLENINDFKQLRKLDLTRTRVTGCGLEGASAISSNCAISTSARPR